MIGNRHLRELYEYDDEDTSISQLLEILKTMDDDFVDSLTKSYVDPSFLEEEEKEYLTKVGALIDYFLQLHGKEVPMWLRHPALRFKKPYYHKQRISDFDKFRLMYALPAPFRIRNVYFDLEDIRRV